MEEVSTTDLRFPSDVWSDKVSTSFVVTTLIGPERRRTKPCLHHSVSTIFSTDSVMSRLVEGTGFASHLYSWPVIIPPPLQSVPRTHVSHVHREGDAIPLPGRRKDPCVCKMAIVVTHNEYGSLLLTCGLLLRILLLIVKSDTVHCLVY